MPAIDEGLRTLAKVTENVGDDRFEVVGVEVETATRAGPSLSKVRCSTANCQTEFT